MKGSLLPTAIAVARVFAFFHSFPKTHSHRVLKIGLDDACTHNRLHYSRSMVPAVRHCEKTTRSELGGGGMGIVTLTFQWDVYFTQVL